MLGRSWEGGGKEYPNRKIHFFVLHATFLSNASNNLPQEAD